MEPVSWVLRQDKPSQDSCRRETVWKNFFLADGSAFQVGGWVGEGEGEGGREVPNGAGERSEPASQPATIGTLTD